MITMVYHYFMTTHITPRQQGSIHPVAVAIVGAVIGAGIAVASAAALRNKKNREKVREIFNTFKDQAAGYIKRMQKQAGNKKEQIEDKLT